MATVYVLLPNTMAQRPIVCVRRLVNMGYMAVVGSKAVNGVAAIHSEIIKDTIFKAGSLLLCPPVAHDCCCPPRCHICTALPACPCLAAVGAKRG